MTDLIPYRPQPLQRRRPQPPPRQSARPETVEVVEVVSAEVVHRVEVTHYDGDGIGCSVLVYAGSLVVLGMVVWLLVWYITTRVPAAG